MSPPPCTLPTPIEKYLATYDNYDPACGRQVAKKSGGSAARLLFPQAPIGRTVPGGLAGCAFRGNCEPHGSMVLKWVMR
jgi:hypothetical protein